VSAILVSLFVLTLYFFKESLTENSSFDSALSNILGALYLELGDSFCKVSLKRSKGVHLVALVDPVGTRFRSLALLSSW
jgi:hypothetical protein